MSNADPDRCKCGAEFIRCGGESSTLVGFVSPPGHNHNDNCRTRQYTCENLHLTYISAQNSCDACDWVGKASCFCHPGAKPSRWPTLKQAYIANTQP